jgi:hypothetical protein
MANSFPCLTQNDKGTLIRIQAVPRASKTEIVDIHQDRCRIRVKAPPVDGEANKELTAALAKIFRITKKKVILQSGQRGKQKCFLLAGVTEEESGEILAEVLSGKGK